MRLTVKSWLALGRRCWMSCEGFIGTQDRRSGIVWNSLYPLPFPWSLSHCMLSSFFRFETPWDQGFLIQTYARITRWSTVALLCLQQPFVAPWLWIMSTNQIRNSRGAYVDYVLGKKEMWEHWRPCFVHVQIHIILAPPLIGMWWNAPAFQRGLESWRFWAWTFVEIRWEMSLPSVGTNQPARIFQKLLQESAD